MDSKNFKVSPTLSLFFNIYRVFAALCVLFGHCFWVFKKTIFKDQMYFPAFHQIGLVMLFLLSGFLSANSFFRKKDDTTYNFTIYFIERACRIGMGLLPALIFTAILDRITILFSPGKYTFMENYNLKTFIATLLNLQYFFTVPDGETFVFLSKFRIETFGTTRQLWSLPVEWWMYMAVGYIVLELLPASKKNRFTLKHLLITFFVCWQPAEFLFGVRKAFGNIVFIWLLGYLIFYICLEITNTSSKHKNNILPLFLYTLFSIAFLIFLGISLKRAYSFLFVLGTGNVFLSSTLLMNRISMLPSKRIKDFFSTLASYTYTLYLVQTPIMCFFIWNAPNLNRAEQLFLSALASLLVPILLYHGFERFGKILSEFLITKYRNAHA